MNEGDVWEGRMNTYMEEAERQIAALRADRDRLAAEVAALRTELGDVLADWNGLVKASGSKTNGAAIGNVARLREDAERYRMYRTWVHGSGPPNDVHLMLANARTADQVDAAIDAARRAGEVEK